MVGFAFCEGLSSVTDHLGFWRERRMSDDEDFLGDEADEGYGNFDDDHYASEDDGLLEDRKKEGHLGPHPDVKELRCRYLLWRAKTVIPTFAYGTPAHEAPATVESVTLFISIIVGAYHEHQDPEGSDPVEGHVNVTKFFDPAADPEFDPVEYAQEIGMEDRMRPYLLVAKRHDANPAAFVGEYSSHESAVAMATEMVDQASRLKEKARKAKQKKKRRRAIAGGGASSS